MEISSPDPHSCHTGGGGKAGVIIARDTPLLGVIVPASGHKERAHGR